MIISIINNKGGVGKTTVTCNLAHALANKGKKVLVIDQDSQANTTDILLPNSDEYTMYDIYTSEIPAKSCVYPTAYKNLFIMPNTTKTGTIEVELHKDVLKSYFILKNRVRDYATDNYDFTLIDNPPDLGMFCIMALIASDSVIVPMMSGSRASLKGFNTAYKAIEATSAAVSHELKFLRAVVNMVDMRELVSKTAIAYLREKFDGKIFNSTIPRNTDIMKAEAEQKTVLRFAPNSSSARHFKALADELLALVE